MSREKDRMQSRRKKNRKIRKLRRGHIWPSLLLFLCSIVISIFMLVVFLSAFITYELERRVEGNYDNALKIGTLADKEIRKTRDYEETLKSVTDFASDLDYIAIVNEKNEVMSSSGQANVDFSRPIVITPVSGMENIFIYLDEGVSSEFDGAGVTQIVKDTLQSVSEKSGYEAASKEWMNERIYGLDYYVKSSIGGAGDAILIKYSLEFCRKDFVMISILTIVTLSISCFLMLLLFCNVLTNLVNQHRMIKLLNTDTVTGGQNWFSFENSVGKILSKRFNFDKTFAIIDFTFMKYRGFCTCHGARMGEELLTEMDCFFEERLKRGEKVSRASESSFAILLKCQERHSSAENSECSDACKRELEDRVGAWLKEIVNLPGLVHQSHGVFHVGVYFVNRGKEKKKPDVTQFYNYAVAAREIIPSEEASQIACFSDKLLEEQLWRHHVEEKMEAALENEEFQVYIQPKYHPSTEELSGAEALVRWINEEDGFVSPGKFIPIFEQNGFITKLDDYMISHVAKLQADWLAKGKKIVPISVNVSRAHFAQDDLAEHICRLVDAYKLPHEYIEIELTESAFFDDKAALLRTVHKMKELGFAVSMDDFGAGYSSLNSLKDLPLDVLKLDADFFRGEDFAERGEIVVSEAIRLAKNLNMRIVAEGVEKKEQVDFLAGQGCDMIQGFYFAKPMPTSEYEEKM